MSKPTILIALGGNALIQAGQQGSVEEQLANLKPAMETVAKLIDKYTVVLTHGNGPHVGNILLQQESTDEVYKQPLAVVGAMTQGQIGFLMETALTDALNRAGKDAEFTTLVTYVVVDKNDPAFKDPTKYVGPFFSEEDAKKKPYPVKDTKSGKGWRRVVASPAPLEIGNYKEVKALIDQDVICICVGGGGVPVTRTQYSIEGIDAVIDKDLASALLAEQANIGALVIATDESNVCINYKKDNEEKLSKMTVADCDKYLAEGQFPAGSMGPKIEAAASFVRKTGRNAIITTIANIAGALEGKAGTTIVK